MATTKRKLRIAQLATPWYPVPPKKYGGIERIVHLITEELVKRGHQVSLFASGDSKTKAKLISPRKKCLTESNIPWSDSSWSFENLNFAFKKAADFDVIHAHTGLRTIFFQGLVKTPVIHTFHNPIQSKSKKLPELLKILKLHKNETKACFISKQARKICPVKFKKNWVVYNGIDLNLFRFNPKAKDYFLWVGRMEKYKGIENVIKAAETAGVKLYLAGKIDKEKRDYFEKKVKPHLSGKIKYLGELPQGKLLKLYAESKGFLYPIEWQEPFGLTMVEAMACGTPVVAFDLGSVKEVVKNNKTGFVVPFLKENGQKNISGFVEAVKKIGKIKRNDCRKWVEKNFTIEKMVDNYEKIYYQILNRS